MNGIGKALCGRLVAICTVAVLGGCSTLPNFNVLREPTDVPTVEDVSKHIQCELQTALADSTVREMLRGATLVATPTLTLEVTNQQGLTPVLNFIDPLTDPKKNFTAMLNGKLTGTQKRTINVGMTLTLTTDAKPCGEADTARKGFAGIEGDLGLKEIMLAGLARRERFIYQVYRKVEGKTAISSLTFGSNIEFTIIYGLGGAPKWTMTHFSAPQANDGLLNVARTSKDTLTIGFALSENLTDVRGNFIEPSDEELASAVRASEDNVTRMILQNILPRP
ncbi:MAG: hypothetical protein LCH56_16500 [Proteobacteria bacterium]|nr:hypothetical protein [Pseudomonadota bacterium]